MSDARQVSTSVPALIHYALVAVAKEEGRSVSSVINIEEGLQRQARLPREAKKTKVAKGRRFRP
jgi:hypothetical protein